MTSKKRPTLRFLRAHPLHWIALGLGSGLFPWMPGTVGALLGWLSFVLLERILAPAHWIALIIAGFGIGVIACGAAARALGVHDPAAANWDEVVAFWLVLFFVMPLPLQCNAPHSRSSVFSISSSRRRFDFSSAVLQVGSASCLTILSLLSTRYLLWRFGRAFIREFLKNISLVLDLLSLAVQVGRVLKQARLTLVTAEPCTGGVVAAAITDIAGSSAWFERGFVTYSNASKTELLGIPAEIIEQYGAVSRPVARAMAEGALRNSHARVALSITGVAGPGGGTARAPVGAVCFAWSSRWRTSDEMQRFSGNRCQVRNQAAEYALNGLLKVVAASV